MGFSFRVRMAGCLAAAFVASGCGYSLQNSRAPLVESEGIRTLFISPLTNNTYKVGVENLLYNSLQRTISAHRRVSLVGSAEEADAVLSGSVETALMSGIASTGIQDRAITTQYSATFSCSLRLARSHPKPGKRTVLWTGSLSRNKQFPSAVQPGIAGETTALINDSEFDRTLGDLAGSLAADAHEAMLAMF
jgi:hypothetical protein